MKHNYYIIYFYDCGMKEIDIGLNVKIDDIGIMQKVRNYAKNKKGIKNIRIDYGLA